MVKLARQRPRCPTCDSVMVGDKRPARAYVCPQCSSAWLPRMTLTSAKVKLPDSPPPGARAVDRRPCPGCDRLMAMRGDESLQIDVCIYCGGVFLDRGELLALRRYEPPKRAVPIPFVPLDAPRRPTSVLEGATLLELVAELVLTLGL